MPFLKTVVLLFFISNVYGQTPDASTTPSSRSSEQDEGGAPDFIYFNDDAKAAAHKLQAILVKCDDNIDDYVDDLKTSNSASLALKKYNDAEASAKGTNCYIGGSDENRFSDSPKEIETAIKTCKSFTSQDDREEMRKSIVKSVAKIQSYDNNLKLNAMVCFSLRVPPSQGCVDSKNKALEGIKNVVSTEEVTKFEDLGNKIFKSNKEKINSCVSNSTKQLEKQLDSWTKQITNCQASLKQ